MHFIDPKHGFETEHSYISKIYPSRSILIEKKKKENEPFKSIGKLEENKNTMTTKP